MSYRCSTSSPIKANGKLSVPYVMNRESKPALSFDERQGLNQIIQRLLKLGIIVCGAFYCLACSSVHTKTPEGDSILMSEEEFSAYAERVFRHHNRVVNQSLYADPNGSAGADDPLSLAESKMDNACQPLNELASATADGQPLDFWMEWKLAEAVPDCESATRSLERLFRLGD